MLETWIIGSDTLEFQEETHTYLVNGEKVESITQLIHHFFPNKYDGVDKEVLQNAAKRGSLIHANIQMFEEIGWDIPDCEELQNWKLLKHYYKIECIKNEIPIILRIGKKTYAGRLDLVLKQNNLVGLADIKTTYTLDKEYLILQLNLYRLGYQQTYGTQIDFLYGVHLRKGIKQLVSIPIKEEQVKKMVIELED